MSSSVLVWPDAEAVDRAAREWALRELAKHPQTLRMGYFGSYARGDWGVGSDLDLIAILTSCDEPFERRGTSWDLTGLPVPAELLIYSQQEWSRLLSEGGRFARVVEGEAVWIHPGAASQERS